MSTSVPEGGSAAKPQPERRRDRRSRPRPDPATREGMIDDLLGQLRRALDNGRKSDFHRGLLSLVVTIESIRDQTRRDGRRIEWCWPDAPRGYFTTPVLSLLPEPAQVIQIEPYLKRRQAGA